MPIDVFGKGGPPFLKEWLIGSAYRRVACVSRNEGKAVESPRELSSIKGFQPKGGSSKTG